MFEKSWHEWLQLTEKAMSQYRNPIRNKKKENGKMNNHLARCLTNLYINDLPVSAF